MIPNVVPLNSPPPMAGVTNGLMTAVGQRVLDAQAKALAEQKNNAPVVQGLAGHIRSAWETNKREKRPVKDRMLEAIRMRRGEYDPDKLSLIRQQGGSEIYMLLASAKARTIASWMRDILLSKGTEKPWTVDPTPIPEVPPAQAMALFGQLQGEVQAMVASGQPIDVQGFLEDRKADLLNQLKEEAKETAEKMEAYMEDQLVEGGFMKAISQGLEDYVTFPAMILKGPVIRKRSKLQWQPDPMTGEWTLQTAESLVPEWERVDPFHVYPAPNAETVDDGDFIEFHRLSRADLQAMIGVEGYSEEAIRAVLEENGQGGLQEWTTLDSERASAEGRETTDQTNPSKLIDALQYWGSVQGKHLIEWGMDEAQVADPLAEYEVEAWLIGSWVIKAIINPEPLGRRPYYHTSWEKIPGVFWGNSPLDQIKDTQDMCNAAARAIANNMGIASGPNVWVNVDRLPPGEDITNLHPWKIWQVTSDPTGASAAPLGFFQPNSNVAELMAVYDKFSSIADEVVGVPKYMSGDAPGGGIGRTATGMSMLMSHAGKVMQQAVGLIDLDILSPLLERLYHYNMKYADDPSIKGDVQVQARGANSLMVRESAQVRRNEFLQSTNNPVDLQITGLEGRAVVLREQAKALDLSVDKIVPDPEVIKMRQQMMQMQQAQLQQAQPPMGSGQELPDGQPTEDNFPST